MALLNILQYPDPRLHKVAKPVAVVDDRIRKLVADMAETMYDAPGIGLAATQVDVYERVIPQDLIQNAIVVASFAYQAATRDALFPRKPLPKPRPATPAPGAPRPTTTNP